MRYAKSYIEVRSVVLCEKVCFLSASFPDTGCSCVSDLKSVLRLLLAAVALDLTITTGTSMHFSSLLFRFWVEGVGKSTGGGRLTSSLSHVRCDGAPTE